MKDESVRHGEREKGRHGDIDTRGEVDKTAEEKNLLSLNIPASPHLRVSVSAAFILHPLNNVLVDKAADGAPHYSAASMN